MNVFVLCTGRCGSTTFAHACRHITNYTSGHETRSGFVGTERLAYPDRHIEVDNRLAWFLGRLTQRFPYALYVHLTRDKFQTASSFLRRYGTGIIGAYAEHILMRRDLQQSVDPIGICLDYVDTVNANIELVTNCLLHRSMTVSIENVESDFRKFWTRIEATGNLEAAVWDLYTRHNAS